MWMQLANGGIYTVQCDIKGESQNDCFMAKLTEDNEFAGYFKTSAKTGEGIEEAVREAQKEVRNQLKRMKCVAYSYTIFQILQETFPNPPEVCETPDNLKI